MTYIGHDPGLSVLVVIEILADAERGEEVGLLLLLLLQPLHRLLEPHARLLKVRGKLVPMRTICPQKPTVKLETPLSIRG